MNNIASKTKNQIYKFLRKTQKYTETDNVYLAKGGFWLTLGQIISAIAGLLSIIAFANLLDPATYGNYKYILSLIGILGIFSLSGIKTAISQSVARGFEESFYSGLRIKFRYSLLGSATAVLLSIYYFIQGNNNLSVPLLASAIFLPLLQATQVFIPLLNGKKLFSNQIKYTSAIKIISTLSIIAALLVAKNIIWLISVFLISNTLLNSFFYLLVKNKFKPNKKTDPRTISYGKHASIAEGLNVAANYLDHLLIFNLLGPGALAVYSFSILLPNKLKNVFGTISLLALPKFAQRSKQEIKKSIFQKIAKLLSLILPITIIYIFCAPFIYKRRAKYVDYCYWKNQRKQFSDFLKYAFFYFLFASLSEFRQRQQADSSKYVF